MTRKRYIKKLMAYGVSRNDALRHSMRVAAYGSYNDLWREEAPGIILAQAGLTPQKIRKIGEAIARVFAVVSAIPFENSIYTEGN